MRAIFGMIAGGVMALTGAAHADGVAGYYLAARNADQAHDYRTAAALYGRALAADPSNTRLMELALSTRLSLGQVDKAAQLARQMAVHGGVSQAANMALIADLARPGTYKTLGDVMAQGTVVGKSVDGLIRAWALLGEGRTDAAFEAFEALSDSQGMRGFALYHMAMAYAVSGEFDVADAILSGASHGDMQPTRRSVIAHAQILAQLDRREDALALIAASFTDTRDATIADLKDRLASGAPVPFEHVTNPRCGMAEVFYTIGLALRGEVKDGYTLLYSRVAEALDPTHVEAAIFSAELLESLGRHTLAKETYARIPRSEPAFVLAEMGRADAMKTAKDPSGAIEVMQRLAESHARRPGVHRKLGDFLRQAGHYEQAIAAYDRTLELHDRHGSKQWFTVFARGIAKERLGQWEKAEADFRYALRLKPGQPQVLNYLGYSMLEQDRNLEEALALIETAVAARPDSGHILDSLGWALFRLGRYEEAVAPMEEASELLPIDPTVNDHLGDGYWMVGRETEARFQWRRALSFGPEEEVAERIRLKLQLGLDEVRAREAGDIVTLDDELEPLRFATDG
ncbi:MAG: tetratricopeptide repeat protein [Shimia sp.]